MVIVIRGGSTGGERGGGDGVFCLTDMESPWEYWGWRALKCGVLRLPISTQEIKTKSTKSFLLAKYSSIWSLSSVPESYRGKRKTII